MIQSEPDIQSIMITRLQIHQLMFISFNSQLNMVILVMAIEYVG